MDYEDERFTLDERYVQAVMKVFVDLYDKGLIYRDHYLVNWDPGSRSAICDLEVEEREVTDELFQIAYPLADGDGEIVVATVRPETMLADTAVAVNPGDERYRDLVGRTAILPLVGRELPIIADEYVKPEFGTGALKITPGHDPNDFEIGRRHGLEQISVIGEDGRITEAAPERDPDVLDTWFSSALWPFATLGWPQHTPALRAFYPTDVLVTARDIIFLWVARMIMMGLEFAGEVPFDDVHIHAIIQAPDGRRMSKSLGTGIDPLDLINGGPRPPVFEKGESFPAYGADALRWGLLAMASSQDVRFSEERIAQGLQLTNKLWNAARLILLGVGPDARPAVAPAAVEDRWILSRLERARDEVSGRIDRYDFSHAALALYDFVYGELCDWSLALVKPRLRAGEPEVSATLLHVLVGTLAVAHPVIPFITEEIYGYVPGASGLLAAGSDSGPAAVDARA